MSNLEPTTQNWNGYARRYGLVFAAVVGVTLVMVAASYLPLPSRSLNIALILASACVNASLVAGYLMHLVSERKMIYALLVFTFFFFAMLMTLTVWSTHDAPHPTPHV